MIEEPFEDSDLPGSSDGRYWGEEEWEAFLREQDEGSEGELDGYEEWSEDLMDDIYAWDHDYPDEDDEIYDEDEDYYREGPEEGLQGEVPGELGPECYEDFEDIPAWRAAYFFGKEACNFVSSLDTAELQREGTRLKSLLYNSSLIAAHIAGGHGIGYEDEFICGNIVKCKLALACTDECITVLNELVTTGPKVNALLSQARFVRSLIERRISELRKRVWW